MKNDAISYYLIFLFIVLTPFHIHAQNIIPAGKIVGPYQLASTIYPGTVRDYWIYVPHQYNSQKATCSMIVQDGLRRAEGWGLPGALDTLIARNEMPVTIGIFVDPGKVPSADSTYPRYNRSFEYDALGDRYANFLLEELIPAVSEKYNLSNLPNDRCIAGASSGAICAFNAAWERPDAFHRVLSTIGTYVGLRGGDEFHTLVRKTEPKPLRVFLEDGNTDLNIYAGDWWMANQTMLSALQWAGYEVEYIWGEEGHNSRGARKIIKDALKWIWKDYPQPVSSHLDKYQGLNLIIPGENWLMAQSNLLFTDFTTGDQGTLWLTAKDKQGVYQFSPESDLVQVLDLDFEPSAICSGPEGTLYLANPEDETIVNMKLSGEANILVRNVVCKHMIASPQGIYFFDKKNSEIGFYHFIHQQEHRVAAPEEIISFSITPEKTFLQVGFANQVMGYSYKIMEDGKIQFGQEYIHFHIPYGDALPGLKGMTVDNNNRLYSSTTMGIQVADQLGRINFIISSPVKKSTGTITFGGNEMNVLFCLSAGKIFYLRLNAKGHHSWDKAIRVPQPRM